MLSRNVSVKVEQTLGGLERCVTHTLSLRKSPKSSVSHTLCVLRKVNTRKALVLAAVKTIVAGIYVDLQILQMNAFVEPTVNGSGTH